MALKQLVEGECGGPNPLMQWSSHMVHSQPTSRGTIHHDRLTELSNYPEGREEEEMVREFLGQTPHPLVPQTFNMSSLLQELQNTPQIPQEAGVESWIEEFGNTHGHQHPLVKNKEREWIDEFTNEPLQQWLQEYSNDTETSETDKWIQEFQSDVQKEGEISKVAQEFSETVTDPKIQATEFMQFIKKLGTGELNIENNEVVTTTTETQAQEWTKEFDEEMRHNEGEGLEDDGGFWSRLEQTWEGIAKEDPSSHPWLTEYEKEQQEYKFVEDNPMAGIENPLEEGLNRLKKGDLPAAVLLFEVEVQQHPDSIEGWQYLGSSQAHNEQEVSAIAALERCLQLDPGNLSALQALAVSYTNESSQSKACQTLRRWLQANPKYSSLVPQKPNIPQKPFMYSFMSKEEHEEITSLYLRAAQSFPDEIDSDIQIGLGVLFNLSNEYDKAVDCFTAALQVSPEDAMLWNKLGATLANNNRSDEAIHAYRRALEYAPGFTRCRYNLGISCINLGAHREAVEHFLTALNLQNQADTPTGMKSQMSEGIWSTLRLAILYLGKRDLLRLVDSKNLDMLIKEFNV